MATIMHAQYNSPMPLYSNNNVQEVLQQVTNYPRPHSAMSGSFDPSHSHVYRYLQSSGQLPSAHSARYEERPNNDPNPRYRGFVDPNVQSPSFKRLQYVTGVDSGTEDEIQMYTDVPDVSELQQPPQIHTDDVKPVKPTGGGAPPAVYTPQQTSESQAPIALGYAPIANAAPQSHEQHPQFIQQTGGGGVQSTWTEEYGGPPVAQRDPAAGESVAGPTFAKRIADAERPKIPPPVVPSWARYADKKHERWEQHGVVHHHQQQQPAPAEWNQPTQTPPPPQTVQYYRPPQPSQQQQHQPLWTLDASKAAQDKWQAHYTPYHFESGTAPTPVVTQRPRSRSVEPAYVPGRRYGGPREWFKPFIAPNLRFNYGDGFSGFGPPGQPSYSPLSSGRTHATTQQDYSQYYGSQSAGATSPYYGGGTQTYTSGTPTTGQNYYDAASGGAGASAPAVPQSTPSWAKESQYSRTAYETRTEGSGGAGALGSTSGQQQAVAVPWKGTAQAGQGVSAMTQSQTLWQSESEARRQKQLLEEEVRKRAASVGPTTAGRQVHTTASTVSSGGPQWQQQRTTGPQGETRVTTYTTSTGGGSGPGPRWQQAPGTETKSQSSGSYLDKDGKTVNFTKEVYTSSDPGKEFSMLTEQEKKILEEPLQPGVIARHITTKYYKKSTFTSTTTTSTSQAPPVTTTIRQPIQAAPSANAPGRTQF